jgi:hypothetical protein
LIDLGEIYTFGCNDEGALGRDTSEEGSEFEPGLVKLPGKATLISAGDSHTASLLEDGRCFIWGTFRVIFTFLIQFENIFKFIKIILFMTGFSRAHGIERIWFTKVTGTHFGGHTHDTNRFWCRPSSLSIF